ncbi:MAG: UDP-N-acetylmuramate dehydrogenase [Candidatus Cloacimonetes bacterium]|nr:UDP-N-acetylmuramate dehydrogenase [Candidatus Cloacimonadota bacterium]
MHDSLNSVLNRNDVTLKRFSHIRIGETVDYLLFPKSEFEMMQCFEFSNSINREIYLLGGGSNTLFGDEIAQLVVSDRLMPKNYILNMQNNTIEVSSNININWLINYLLAKGYGGLEFLYGIPANIGGLIKMNAGAYNKSICDNTLQISVIDRSGRTEFVNTKYLPVKENLPLKYEYRKSNVRGYVQTVLLKIQKKAVSEIKKELKAHLSKRLLTQPMNLPNLGSVFKNPQGESVWKLLDDCQLRGERSGDAEFSRKHCNFIVNLGNATFKNVYSLIETAKERVKDKYNIILETEIKVVGK